GSGRTETVRALFGADRVEGGEIELRGRRLPRLFLSPKQAVAHGIALVTENRKDEGLLLPLSIRANLTLPRLSELCRRGVVLSGGSVAATFTRERFDQDAILVAALRDHAGGNGAG